MGGVSFGFSMLLGCILLHLWRTGLIALSSFDVSRIMG